MHNKSLHWPAGLILLLFSSALASSQPTLVVEEGFIETNGTNLYFKTLGTGEPIVVLHGGPGFDHQQFMPHLDELAGQHKLIFYDQRGTGRSEGPVDSNSITIENFIEDLEGIRKAFGIEKMNLLGHSWGGMLAMHYSILHHDKLKSLVLASTAASVQSFSDTGAAITSRRDPEDTALLESIHASESFKENDPKAIELFWDVYFRVHFQDPDMASQLHTPVTANTIRYSNDVAGYILASVGQFDLHDALESVDVPTMIIHGDLDLMPVSYARKIHRSLPDSQLVIVEGSGHWVFVDGRELFTESISDFLERTDARNH